LSRHIIEVKPARKLSKPTAPHPEFPLYAHPLGYWSKKINGRIRHFGRWGRRKNNVVVPVDDYVAGWREALAAFKAQIDDLKLAREPRLNYPTNATVQEKNSLKDVINLFLRDKKDLLDAGKISHRSFEDYISSGERLAAVVGKGRSADDLRPDDFTTFTANSRRSMARCGSGTRCRGSGQSSATPQNRNGSKRYRTSGPRSGVLAVGKCGYIGRNRASGLSNRETCGG
jgi:hypothetical protein